MRNFSFLIKSGVFCTVFFCISIFAAKPTPILEVSSNNYYFIALESGNDPNDQILTITNTGDGTLNWEISDVNEITFNPPDWLTITPTSGSLKDNESEPVTLSADITGLSGGQYSYSFQVSDPLALNSPQIINVYLNVISQYPIAHWQLDGDATDSSGNGYHGTIHGDPNWIAEGKVNGCIDLDGVDDYIEADSYSGVCGTSSRTVCAWLKTTVTNAGPIVSWGNGSMAKNGHSESEVITLLESV